MEGGNRSRTEGRVSAKGGVVGIGEFEREGERKPQERKVRTVP